MVYSWHIKRVIIFRKLKGRLTECQIAIYLRYQCPDGESAERIRIELALNKKPFYRALKSACKENDSSE